MHVVRQKENRTWRATRRALTASTVALLAAACAATAVRPEAPATAPGRDPRPLQHLTGASPDPDAPDAAGPGDDAAGTGGTGGADVRAAADTGAPPPVPGDRAPAPAAGAAAPDAAGPVPAREPDGARQARTGRAATAPEGGTDRPAGGRRTPPPVLAALSALPAPFTAFTAYGRGAAEEDGPPRRTAEPRDAGAGPGEAGRKRAQGAPGRRRLAPRAAAPALALSAAHRAAQTRSTADALAAHAAHLRARIAAHRRWGLKKPLPVRPAPPVLKPRVRDAEVLSRVPTDDRVVFLTVDDGAEKDPEFLELVADLDLPVSSFLTDEEAMSGAGYDYFRALARRGGTVQNHTLHHRYLPALSYRKQRREICGQQDQLKEEFGGPQPRLFRPPYGAYDKDTLRAARDCGLDAVVLWGMEAWAGRIDFQKPGRKLYPGAIILTHYRGPEQWGGSMADMTRRVLRLAAKQGFAVARLEDYL